MAYFRIPLFLNRRISFYKLLGCGKNGTFDTVPDVRQWGIIVVRKSKDNLIIDNSHVDDRKLYGSFIVSWWSFFRCKRWTIALEPIEGHGRWDGKEAFGSLPRTSDYDGLIAVLTRATIRLSSLRDFWKNVAGVAKNMASANGFVTSLGIGEAPWVKQATFSVWENKDSLKAFAYKMKEHTEVIKKTRQENWYSEDMFVRFKILASAGTVNNTDPLKGKL